MEAGSVLTRSVLRPRSASHTAVAQAREVFPHAAFAGEEDKQGGYSVKKWHRHC
uniref:Uncharacterized protein n=1 Tax=Klebsiella pneumoniae TaxID=573 RepID=A0A8B0STB7_KLEPN|nr:hypothetical protein [Klebsiella pneumoniae]